MQFSAELDELGPHKFAVAELKPRLVVGVVRQAPLVVKGLRALVAKATDLYQDIGQSVQEAEGVHLVSGEAQLLRYVGAQPPL